jgi:hypothetical protein
VSLTLPEKEFSSERQLLTKRLNRFRSEGFRHRQSSAIRDFSWFKNLKSKGHKLLVLKGICKLYRSRKEKATINIFYLKSGAESREGRGGGGGGRVREDTWMWREKQH